ncbi:MAG TPA: metal ABC transporter substrate-binding protein [Micromonosporaceae bacterium]
MHPRWPNVAGPGELEGLSRWSRLWRRAGSRISRAGSRFSRAGSRISSPVNRLGGRPGRVGLTLAGVALLTLSGCGLAGGSNGGGRSVVAAFYPLQYVAEQIGGSRVTVTNLAPPGSEPHDLELSPRQLMELSDAALVLYLAGFQPAVDEAVRLNAASRALDAAGVVPLVERAAASGAAAEPGAGHAGEADQSGPDPHLWLDPTRLASVGDAVAARLASIDPDGATGYRERAASLRRTLADLDAEYSAGLRSCQRREIITSHTAFGYLADRYRLTQVGITGLSPESEPTPQRLAQVAAEARRTGATTIFFESLVSPRVAEAIASEIGAKTAVLDPIEGLSPGSTDDYVSVMRRNLSALRTALGCA